MSFLSLVAEEEVRDSRGEILDTRDVLSGWDAGGHEARPQERPPVVESSIQLTASEKIGTSAL